jgi:hypothetical protein
MDLAESARRLAPKEPATADAMGWGLPECESSSLRASRISKKAVKGAPRNALFQYHLGVAYEAMAEFAKRPKQALTTALAISPNAPWAADARKLLAGISGP